jgi:glycosyltransferase involved in cell wall biosynthesis
MPPIVSASRPAPILFAHWGDEGIRGSERVLLDLLGTLDRDRYTPTLWCNAATMADAARALDVPTRVSRMPILLGWDAPKLDVAGYRRLVQEGKALIQELGARVVHANSGAPNQWLVPAARAAQVPLVAHLHAIYGLRERCTLLLHQAPCIIGCSEAVVAPFWIDGVPRSRVRVIHNGVRVDRLQRGDASALRGSLGIGALAVVALGVGALVPLKGFDTVMRAVRLARDHGVDLHLLLAGEGPERARLDALRLELGLEGFVHFLGQRADVGAILRDAVDVAVIGSRVESFALVAAEAGAMGRPTIATRVGGIGEVVADGVTGILVPAGDATACADALTRIGRDEALRRTMGEAARVRVASKFSTAQATQAFEHLYQELADRPARSFGWSALGVRLMPFARLGANVVRRRLGRPVIGA